MESSEFKQYEFEGGRIRIYRHFGKSGYPADIIRDNVIRTARESARLTPFGANDKLPLSLREPQ